MQNAMLRRGSQLQVPQFKDLAVSTDDDSIVELLSRLLGIPENRTDVALEQESSTNLQPFLARAHIKLLRS